MSISFPSWWRGGSPDIERTVKDLFTFEGNLAAVGLSGVQVVSWLPNPDDARVWLADGNAFLRVFRVGGTFDDGDVLPFVDQPRVQLAAWCASRDDAWGLIEYVRKVLWAFKDGGNVRRSSASFSGVTTTFIQTQREWVGPQLIPENILDDRLVPITFEISADDPRGLPDYRGLLQLD